MADQSSNNIPRRDVDIGGDHYILTARRESAPATGWQAGIAGFSEGAHSQPFRRPVRTPHGNADAASDLMGVMVASAPTAEAALNSLEAELRRAVTEATRVDLDEINRGRRTRPNPPFGDE